MKKARFDAAIKRSKEEQLRRLNWREENPRMEKRAPPTLDIIMLEAAEVSMESRKEGRLPKALQLQRSHVTAPQGIEMKALGEKEERKLEEIIKKNRAKQNEKKPARQVQMLEQISPQMQPSQRK